MSDLAPFLEAAIRTATPLLIAAIGEAIAERAGVINIGMEGCLIAGAYAAFVASSLGGAAGYGAAMLAGGLMGLPLVVFSVLLRRDQIIVGTAITMLGLGGTGALFRARASGGNALVETDELWRIPVLADIPLIGPALFAQPLITYVALMMVPATWWMLNRTHTGLAIRTVGDAPDAAASAGLRTRALQSFAVLAGAALGGLAGGALVLSQAGTFAEGMSAGRGFLAIAIVALGRWRPLGVLLASVVFGAAMALQFVVQSLGWHLRYELVLMIPYVLTLAALGAFGKGSAPAMLGRSDAGHH
jgi:ABC-type uncharacterized transport system permease subunit